MIFFGTVTWLALAAWWRPSPLEAAWAELMLLLAPLVLVPTSLAVLNRRAPLPPVVELAASWQLGAAWLLVASFLLPRGWAAGALALPWLAVTTLLALGALSRLSHRGWNPPGELCIDGALGYVAIGGVWTFFSRAGIRPLAFDPSLVMLTGVHFHYAGFMLPLLTGLAALRSPGALSTAAVWGVLAGVPMVAVGITATQLGLGVALEGAAGVTTAVAAMTTAVLYLRLVPGERPAIRMLWTIAALALLASMLLAASYAARFTGAVPHFDLPRMWALHGTANAVGFALCGILGWRARRG